MAAPVAARPTVKVYDAKTGKESGSAAFPAVFTAPIRKDVVQFVHSNISKNSRQAYAVSVEAGHQTSAESWGTGRAVARIPRVGGGGTHRSGQGAFGNMCRKGRMFAPTKIWRRWHRHVNVNQRRYALVSALAASTVTALVEARGHKVSKVNEIPVVISNVADVKKTKQAAEILAKVGAAEDVQRAADSKKQRAGKGKSRNRRYVIKRGPLVVYSEAGVDKAFRNLPGVDVAHIDRLNLLQLAPGGHVGRFVIWTQGAFEKLSQLYGTTTTAAALKTGYTLPRSQMANSDLKRLINSTEIQSKVRPAVKDRQWPKQKKNPLTNFKAMVKLNPYAAVVRKAEQAATKKGKQARTSAARRAASKRFIKSITSDEFVRPAEVQ